MSIENLLLVIGVCGLSGIVCREVHASTGSTIFRSSGPPIERPTKRHQARATDRPCPECGASRSNCTSLKAASPNGSNSYNLFSLGNRIVTRLEAVTYRRGERFDDELSRLDSRGPTGLPGVRQPSRARVQGVPAPRLMRLLAALLGPMMRRTFAQRPTQMREGLAAFRAQRAAR